MKNKVLNSITVFLLISWISVAFFACLYVATRIKNLKLKSSLAAVEEKTKLLSEENKRYEDFKREEVKFQDNALSYMEWQFVLKEQVSRAAKLLQEKINQVKDVKKDKELLNLLYYNLGLNNTLAVNFDAAIKAFEQAVDLEPKDADSYYNLGLLYSTYQQNPRKAVKYYEDYLKLVPKGTKSDEVKERIAILNGRSR